MISLQCAFPRACREMIAHVGANIGNYLSLRDIIGCYCAAWNKLMLCNQFVCTLLPRLTTTNAILHLQDIVFLYTNHAVYKVQPLSALTYCRRDGITLYDEVSLAHTREYSAAMEAVMFKMGNRRMIRY